MMMEALGGEGGMRAWGGHGCGDDSLRTPLDLIVKKKSVISEQPL